METYDLAISGWKLKLIKTDNEKTINFARQYVAKLNDCDYNIFKDHVDGKLTNVILIFNIPFIFDVLKTLKIEVQIDVPYCDKKVYYICLNKVEKLTIGIYEFTFIKNNEITMNCEIKDNKYSLVVSEDQYNMFQDYKNGKLKDCIVSSNIESDGVRIDFEHSFYGETFRKYFYLYLIKDIKSRIKELKEQVDKLNIEIKELSEDNL